MSWPEFLVDLAQYEWTFSLIFDGPGVEGKEILDEAKLRAVPPDLHPGRLQPRGQVVDRGAHLGRDRDERVRLKDQDPEPM